jgi:hypothetical protein
MKQYSFLIAFFAFSAVLCFAGTAGDYYVIPKPGTNYALPGHEITVTPLKMENPLTLDKLNFSISGSKSGNFDFIKSLSADGQSYILTPVNNFQLGEKIELVIQGDKKVVTSFSIVSQMPRFEKEQMNIHETIPYAKSSHKLNKLLETPEGVPQINVEKYDYKENGEPAKGYYFIAPFNILGWNPYPDTYPTLMIVDEEGTPVYYHRKEKFDSTETDFYCDFKKQVDGSLTYILSNDPHYSQLNDKYENAREFPMGNGFYPDLHELIILPNSNRLMMSYPLLEMDLTGVFEGYEGTKRVVYGVVQELDTNNNVIFEWNSLDHVPLEMISEERLEGFKDDETFDYIHLNSIEQDTDTSLIISARHTDQIYRISKNTGEIIWSAGYGPGNQMEMISEVEGETPYFSAQHDARIHPDGTMSIFDNSGLTSDNAGRACFYEIVEENSRMTLKKVVKFDSTIAAMAMGNTQVLDNGNILIGFGTGFPNLIEFNEDGKPIHVVSFEGFNYRGFKFEWEPMAITADTKKLNMHEYWNGDKYTKKVTVTNNLDREVKITEIHFRNPEIFSTPEFAEMTIQPGETASFNVDFTPMDTFAVKDVMTIISDEELGRVACQVELFGKHDPENSVYDVEFSRKISISPLPADDLVRVKYFGSENINGVYVTDIAGNRVMEIENPVLRNSMELNVSGLTPGLYFIHFKTGQRLAVKKIIVR